MSNAALHWVLKGALKQGLQVKLEDRSQLRDIRYVFQPLPVPGSTQYTVLPGDLLSRIAAKVLGNAAKYHQIFDMNRDVIDDPDDVFPGDRLSIPPADAAQDLALPSSVAKDPVAGVSSQKEPKL